MTRQTPANFNMLLASSIHDLKNSLGMVLQTLEETIDAHPPIDSDDRQRYAVLQSEAGKISNSLVALLSLYRLENRQLQLTIDEINLSDFLEEQLAACTTLIEVKQFSVEVECDDELYGYFDRNLMAGVINNAMINALRYAKNRITLSARAEDGGILIEVRDDSDGYPEWMLEQTGSGQGRIDFSTGSTKLGLYFAATIAVMHNSDNRTGRLMLDNLPEGGSSLKVWLP